MAFHPLDLMEGEETVGGIWHDRAGGLGAARSHPGAAATLAALRLSIAVLFRALGGGESVEVIEAPAAGSRHRLSAARKISAAQDTECTAHFDGDRLRRPPVIDAVPDPGLNRAAYLWLAAMAAMADIPAPEADAARADMAQITAMGNAAARAEALCPGPVDAHGRHAPPRSGHTPPRVAARARSRDRNCRGRLPCERRGRRPPRPCRAPPHDLCASAVLAVSDAPRQGRRAPRTQRRRRPRPGGHDPQTQDGRAQGPGRGDPARQLHHPSV